MTRPDIETPAALRGFLRSGHEDAAKVLPELLAGTASIPAGSPALGECAFLLSVILRAQRDPVLAARTLQTLISLGRLGRSLASLHIQSRAVPLPQLSPLLQALPGREFLALVNEMLLEGPAADKQFAAWLKGLLPTPARFDLRESLLFLKFLADEDAPLARPLREALLSAGLADALSRAFTASPGPGIMAAMLAAVEVLAVPALQAEALGFALRTAGGEGPSRLGPLLASPPDLEPREAALAAEMRRLASQPEAPELLFDAARTEPEMLGLVLADMLRTSGQPAAQALRLCPLLPRLGFDAASSDLPEDLRGRLLDHIFSALAILAPDFLRRAARALRLQGPAAHALAALLSAEQAPEPESWPEPPAPVTGQARRTGLAEALSDPLISLKDQDYSHSVLSGTTAEGQTLIGVDLSRSRFSGVTFRRVRFSSCVLAGCAFENCVLVDCAFSATDLSGCVLNGCRLESTSFDACDLGNARFTSCLLAACSLAESSLCGAQWAKCRLEAIAARTSALSGMRLRESVLARSTLLRCDLSAGMWEKALCRDCEFTACTLAGSRLVSCEAEAVAFTRSVMPRLEWQGGHTDNPHLARAERQTRARCLGQACAGVTALAPELAAGPGAAFVRACVESHLRVDQARISLSAMRGQDQRRRELALERLTENQGVFLKLLPLLLATDVFDKAQNLAGIPACALTDRTLALPLGRGARALLERHFPGVPPTEKPEPQLLIEAVYAIGSLGSVAQKPSSDIDCWVCYTPLGSAAEDARAALARKLAALEAWADQQFGLEVHFFAMPLIEVRQNLFGISDKESSGTAQAALLKEEFYRTALKLAGKDLLWWAAPPGASQAEAEALLSEMKALSPRVATELLDLGQPMPIPPGEYFGACLWQIVKALHSPYKSVMKLGLLEKYAERGEAMRLLCDRIKEAVTRGRRRLEEADPYLSLFASIRQHYRALADTASLGLIGECLRLKAEVAPEDLPPEFAEAVAGAPEHGSFAAAMRLGGMVNQFMISAYRRIQEGIRADKNAAQISPEDLTRLGRRIAANFAQHEFKVGLVPFLAEDIAFTELFFYAEKAPGKRTIWAVKGKEKASGKAAVESLAPIRRDTDVARLLTWLLFNGIYDPKLAVQAEKSLAPIAVMDLQNLLADLAAFFPRRATLEPDMDEYLKPERVVRAYIIVNLPVATDKSKVLTASVIFATNWGEIYCQTFDNPSPLLQKSPLGFLREFLAKPIPQDIELRAFLPKKSACPKLKLG